MTSLDKKSFYKQQAPQTDIPALSANDPQFSHFEFWPAWIFYLPMKIYCAYLTLRHAGLTFFASNPSIYASGFVGESKSEILDLVPEESKKYFAEHVIFQGSFKLAEKLMAENNLSYPLVAKPDVGERGAGVQVVFSSEDLQNYINKFPPEEKIMLQVLYDYPSEIGLFYIRKPDEEKGKIFSLTLKYTPKVIGDGKSTLRELIMQDPRAGAVPHLYLERHKENLDDIITAGESYRIAFAGTHSKGSIFKNGEEFITPKMEETWDKLAKTIPELYFCRFDIRFHNMKDLETLENLKIIEINGAGAEATHIWDSKTSLLEAYGVLAEQYKTMFEIGSQNRRRGHKTISVFEFRKIVKKSKNLSDKFPDTF